ncbi:MAG: helix-turn-helix domain-containing protein, partial [Brachybacterium sp.]|nr:helix-turn-helix domain-containing protein [Brachybacterium sp.]
MSIVQDQDGEAPAGQIARALAVLEAVAEHGSSTARGIADATGIPLPTVY